MILKNETSSMVISENVFTADSFFKRLKGLMFTEELSPQNAVYIYPCSGIHTCFMNYNIDVLYLDSNNIILDIDEDVKPWRFGKVRKGAVSVVELPGGRVKETQIEKGQAVILV